MSFLLFTGHAFSCGQSPPKLNILLSLSYQVEYTQIPMSGPPQMQYRPQQKKQGKFTPASGPSQSQGPSGYPQTTVYPTGQPSQPVYIVRAPAAPMTGMPQFKTQSFEPRTRERKIIQIMDPNSKKDMTQEILNRQPSGSLTGSSSSSTTPDISGQTSRSSTPLLTSQQQAEANVRAQFAAQVASTLANDLTETELAETPAEETAKEAANAKVNVYEGEVELLAVLKDPTDMQAACL